MIQSSLFLAQFIFTIGIPIHNILLLINPIQSIRDAHQLQSDAFLKLVVSINPILSLIGPTSPARRVVFFNTLEEKFNNLRFTIVKILQQIVHSKQAG
jgi:hypothetical protein